MFFLKSFAAHLKIFVVHHCAAAHKLRNTDLNASEAELKLFNFPLNWLTNK